MDDPIVGPKMPIRLRRTCERHRMEKQFLIDAYETLVALVTPGGQNHARSEICVAASEENAHSCEARGACAVAHG